MGVKVVSYSETHYSEMKSLQTIRRDQGGKAQSLWKKSRTVVELVGELATKITMTRYNGTKIRKELIPPDTNQQAVRDSTTITEILSTSGGWAVQYTH